MTATPHPGAFSRQSAQFNALKLPVATAGQRIGLFGGSFNPPHRGHRHVALSALSRLGLDQVWWMVTPGNPLKSSEDLPSLQRRVRFTQTIADHPRMVVTAFEAAIGTSFSADAISYAKRRLPAAKLVWLMGADNLASLHRWQKWRNIMNLLPVAVIDRPGASMAALNSVAARAFAAARRPEEQARSIADATPPAWVFLHVPLEPVSSTALRTQNGP
ncbi:MAG: nicotinate-nucleotide adenylyltransferase [Pseudomonadota bacterium]